MEWRRRAVTLLACLLVVVGRVSSREISQDIMDSKTIERVKKWCANTGSDSCGNMYVPGSGDDEEYLNNGDNPGKRALLERFITNSNRARLLKCSTNTGDDSCGNGYVPGSGNDNDYLNNGDNPGKRAAAKLYRLHRLRLTRCSTNTGDDSCGNGYVPGSGDDNDYLNGDDNPGKRSISKLFGSLQHRPSRCSTNTGDDSCGNGYVPGSGNDNDYLNNGDNPGKRASHDFNFLQAERNIQSKQASSAKYDSLRNFCNVFPMNPACRNLK